MEKKKLIKRVVSLSFAFVLCFFALCPSLSASAYDTGTGFPIRYADGQTLIPLSLSFGYCNSDLSGDVYWVSNYPLPLTVRSSGFYSQPIVVDDVTLGVVSYHVDGDMVYFNVELYSFVMFDVRLVSHYPFFVDEFSRISVFSSDSGPRWIADFGFYTYDEVITDDNFSLSWVFDSGIIDFGNTASEAVVKYFNSQVPSDSLVNYFSLRFDSGFDREPYLTSFTVGFPYLSYSDSYASVSDYYSQFEYDIDRSPVVNTIVSEFPTDWFDWVGDAAGGFLNLEIAPGLTFGGVLAAVIGILLFMFFIHVFKG